MQGRPGRVDGTRELVIAATPFVVVYECIEEEIGIVAVMHGSRAWPEVF
jgi:toxin ParE1/3/4